MKKTIALILALTLLVALPLFAGCTKLDKDLEIRVWTLNGTTGFGIFHFILHDRSILTG